MARVLGVGNCGFDHNSLETTLRPFAAELVGAHSATDALDALRSGSYDLVLINRVFDRDGGSGLDLLKAIKLDDDLADTPVMLITNYPDVQSEAEAAGALPGFGKADLRGEHTRELLADVLKAQ